jgi:hypothetical protein
MLRTAMSRSESDKLLSIQYLKNISSVEIIVEWIVKSNEENDELWKKPFSLLIFGEDFLRYQQ